MTFVLRMLWRELRAGWLRLSFFFLCVGIGVASIIVLRSVVQNVRTTLTREARALVGADVIIQSPRPLTAALQDRVDGVLARAGVFGSTAVVDTQTMASPVEGSGNGNVKLVEVRGVEAAYPFYGAVELEGGARYSHELLAGRGVLVQPELLVALGLRPGDPIRLAGQTFTVRGVIAKDRVQRGGGFAFGPRVYVDLADLRATSLLGFGSRATYRTFLRVGDASVAGLTSSLQSAVRQEVVSVRSWQTFEDRLGENLAIAENYLSLVGFAIVVLGGIGVWSVTRVIVQQRIRSIAILKCVGASARQVLSVYVLQVLVLAASGSLLGGVLAAVALAAVPASVLAPLGVDHVSMTTSAAVQGGLVGLLVSLLFALVPLLEMRHVKPLLLLRADTAQIARRGDWRSWLAGAVVATSLVAVAVWQAQSIRAGAFVSGGLFVAASVLYGVSRGLVIAVRPLARSPRFVVRHAVIGLGRPGNQTRVVLMTVGLGCFFILGVRALQANLLDQLATQVGQGSPDFILIDLQSDQRASFAHVSAPYVRHAPSVMPLMRGRVVAVDGRRAKLPTIDAVRQEGRLGREFGLTFRDALEANERTTAGKFWTGPVGVDRKTDGVDTDVSVEQDLSRGSRIDLGDVIRFDIGGQPLSARVTNIRTVAWDESQNGGFVFVLRPGPAVERLPHNYIGFLQVRDDPAARGGLQRDLVRALPNVSVIDVRDLLNSVRDVVSNITLGVSIVGAVMLVGGALILIGAVAVTRFQRLYDAAIYRTLGASTKSVAAMVAIEYGLLGLLAGTLGAAGALALSWALARYLFDIAWTPAVGLLSGGVAVTATAVAAIGVLASVDVLRSKPLGILRRE